MAKILCFLLLPFLGVTQDISLNEIEYFFSKKQYKQAEVELVQFLKDNPKHIEAMALLGDAYGYQKQWDSAIEVYKEVVGLNQTNANYHYKYGLAMGMKGLENRLKAIPLIGDVKTAFHKAADLDKTHIDARWALVKIYMELPMIFGGSKKKSLQYAEELESLSKVDGYLAKGYIYDYDDEFETSETYYKKAVQVGGSLTCYKKLASLYEKEGKLEKAIETIELAQKKLQLNELNYLLGKISATYQVQLEKGKQSLKLYLQNEVLNAWAHYYLAQIYRQQNNIIAATKHINLALKREPNQKKFKEEKQLILN